MSTRFAVLFVAVLLAGCAGQKTPLTPEQLALREMCVELKRALFQDGVVRSFMVYPHCEPDRVVLNGSVRDYDGYLQAERIAYDMTGVRRVQNNLQILEEDDFTPRNR